MTEAKPRFGFDSAGCLAKYRAVPKRMIKLSMTRQARAGAKGIVAFAAIAAFLFTIALSGTPGLHDQLHHSNGLSHECAVTLLSSGGCHLSPCNVSCPELLPAVPVAFATTTTPVVIASLDFSLLEHAPPANS